MKRITNLTEEQATSIVAQMIARRAVRGAKIVRDETSAFRFVIEVETYSAEEESGGVYRPGPEFVRGDRVRYRNGFDGGSIIGTLRVRTAAGNWIVELPNGTRVKVAPGQIERVK